MNKITHVHKVFSFILLFLIYNSTVSNDLYAQGPKAPEASSFEPVDVTDMVNLATGDLSYVIPILNVPSPEGGYPLSLSYHSGIAMEQEASWVGLGWNINPGVINRNVSGQPDDWKDGLNSTITRDIGGTSTSDTFYIGVGWGDDDKNSIGLTANFTTNRAFGGETSYSKSIGVSGNFGNVGLTYNPQQGLGVNLSAEMKDVDGNRMRGEVSLTQKSGVGITLSASTSIFSSGNASISYFGDNGSRSSKNNSSTAYSVMPEGDRLSVAASIGPMRFSYSRSKIKYWHFDEKTYGSTGLLYIGELYNILNGNNGYKGKVLPYFHDFDSSESLYKATNNRVEEASNNPTFVSYDQYDISAQGVATSMTPYIFESGLLHNSFNTNIDGKIFVNGVERDIEGLWYFIKNDFDKHIDSPLNNKRINFHLNNELSSYYNSTSTYDNLWQYSNTYVGSQEFANSVNIPETTENQGYFSNKNRLKQSSYIESYTNKELINNPLLVFKTNIDRNNLDKDGIGAFKITVADGKIYHYSIPVYQKEKFSRTAKYKDNINDKYSEQQSLSPYATHWLLTGITGPDYIDVNGNNELDENDFGYWVKFDYGKWSDGFSWRIPSRDYIYGSNSKSYSWGVKEIYYLNSIKTRSHTAFFVKEARDDYNSIKNKVGVSRGNPLVNNAVYYSYDTSVPIYIGTNGQRYLPGAYSTVSTFSAPYSSAGYNAYEIINRRYAESFAHKTLRLKEIILVKNSDIPSQDNVPVSTSGTLASDMIFDENVKLVGDTEYNTGYLPYVDSKYYGQFYGNVIDINDIFYQNLKNKAIKIIDFNYDYSLGIYSPNSVNTLNYGKLTLKKVTTKGKQGINVIPPYVFRYNNLEYNPEQVDDWGYSKYNPINGSLSQIKTPIGTTIDLQYESDDYAYEATTKSLVFDFNLELKFTGTSSGDKYVEIRNHRDNDLRQNVDFRNYFEVGKYNYVDVQYWWNPDHNGAHRVADVANQCLVVSVLQNQVKLKLPNNIIGSDVRRDVFCDNEEWTFYRWYDEVVDRTSGWREETREFSCGEPGNGNDKVKIKLFSSLDKENVKGGGLRIKKIIVDNKYTTEHYYNVPGTSRLVGDSNYKTSGVTSFAPSKHFKEIPFSGYIPGPGVLYEYVTVVKGDVTNQYCFNVLPKFNLGGIIKYSLGNFFQIIEESSSSVENLSVNVSNYPYSYIPLKKSRFIIHDRLSLLGSLVNKKVLNNKGHVLSNTINNYEFWGINNDVIQENFSSLERIFSRPANNLPTTSDINLVNTSKITYPLKLMSTKTIANNHETSTYFDKYDALTGQVLETRTVSSDGQSFKTKIVPGYNIEQYNNPSGGYGMGSKVDNPTNKNMLSQTAAEYSYILDKGTNSWKVTGVGITTWSNIWSYKDITGAVTTPTAANEKIWRKHKTFVWNGVKDSNGIFTNYNSGTDDGFDWTVGVGSQPNQWKQVSETTLYDHFSASLEMKDINGNLASNKMGDNDTKVMVSGNGGYGEIFYAGAENIKDVFGINWLEPEIKMVNASRSTYFHTGKQSVATTSSSEFGVMMSGTLINGKPQHRQGKYRVSVWVRIDNVAKAQLKVNGMLVSFINDNIVAGAWQLKTAYITVPTGDCTIYLNSLDSSIVYYDDLMVRPVASTITGYVYNEWDELSYIIGNNGLATKFEYDAAGRLIKTYSEVIDDAANSVTGGFKLIKSYTMNNKYLYQ